MAVKEKEVRNDSPAAICFPLQLFSAEIVMSSIYAGYIPAVPFASLLFPIALTVFSVRFKFAAENSRT
mgnify:CR=1 FL=1